MHAVFSVLKKYSFSPEETARLCVRLAALCTILALAQSKDLWFDDNRLIMPVPILPLFGAMPVLLSQVFYFSVMGVAAVLFVRPDFRRLCFYPPAVFALWVLQDQLRWQPFLYMFMFTLLACATLPQKPVARDLDPLRWMVAGIYFWAGFFKINTVFIFSLFPWFMQAWLQDRTLVTALGFIAPFFEAAIGLCLVFPKTRQYGVMLAAGMLAVVLASLGPLGHNWGLIVWPWNVCIEAMAMALFWRHREPLIEKARLHDQMSRLSALLFCLLPVLGIWDAWGAHPSFKLYCGCTPQVSVRFDPREDLSFLPAIALENMEAHDTVATNFIMDGAYGVASTSSVPDGLRPQLAGLTGLCAHLRYPATLKIETMPHIWSMKEDIDMRPLCEGKMK